MCGTTDRERPKRCLVLICVVFYWCFRPLAPGTLSERHTRVNGERNFFQNDFFFWFRGVCLGMMISTFTVVSRYALRRQKMLSVYSLLDPQLCFPTGVRLEAFCEPSSLILMQHHTFPVADIQYHTLHCGRRSEEQCFLHCLPSEECFHRDQASIEPR